MKARDGRSSIYAGVKVRIVEHVVSQVAYYVATDSLPPSDIETAIDEGKEVSEEERFAIKCFLKSSSLPFHCTSVHLFGCSFIRRQWYFDEFMKAATGRSLAVIVSHPFHVCAVRCMAQFIGQETKYW